MKVQSLKLVAIVATFMTMSASPLFAAGKSKTMKAPTHECIAADGKPVEGVKNKKECVAPNKWERVKPAAKKAP